MDRLLLWIPIAALTMAAAAFGLRAGWAYATLTETDAITRYAQHYVNGLEGRSLDTCYAVPGEEKGIWLVVICGENTCDGVWPIHYSEYHLNRLGNFVHGGDRSCDTRSLRPKT